ncbi:sulfotransferase family 2 domain-containing protein [Candidatus Uabimicrobium amorphum]|uniref:Sulfotransferase family protein n=1 Tax=Uabimicrobium amorphum TaxID=2596890 RepID=A0A5S9IIY4_UABAM|nr:sulfotransferase family 2 domain-containing protein [Candidatus Uabimicrobium amorphum]BBM82390.1 hypothetical protein UABAM_00733 [Candidatus Uabimicrobium amorphum]
MSISRYRAAILFTYWRIRRKVGHVIKRKGKVDLPPEFCEKKLVFFHIPKAAGKSLATAIYGTDINHFTYRQVSQQLDMCNYYTFTFVRNPWDRMVSAYNFLCRGGWGKVDRFWVESRKPHLETYSKFLSYVANHPQEMVHFLPQTYWLSNHNSEIALDFIGKFEHLHHDYQKLCAILNIDSPLPHINASKRNKDYRSYYKTSKDVEIIRTLYKNDIRVFGYEYE